jgi:hypothetical protein
VKFQKEKYRNWSNDKETKKILDEEEKKDDLIADSINNDDITKDSINNVDTNTEKEIEKDEFNIKEKVLIKEKEE